MVPLHTARNDAAGVWRITVKDLCSGKTAEARLAVL